MKTTGFPPLSLDKMVSRAILPFYVFGWGQVKKGLGGSGMALSSEKNLQQPRQWLL